MDFMSALRYPFNSMAKVFTIVLGLTLALVICLALILSSADWSAFVADLHKLTEQPELFLEATKGDEYEHFEGLNLPVSAGFSLLLFVIVAALGGIWVAGYSVDVMRAVMAGDEVMPAINFGANLRDGWTVFLACLFYGIAGCVVVVAFVILASLGGLAALAGFVVMIGLFFLLGWAYCIGLARYAIGEGSGAFMSILANTGQARAHWKAGLALTGWTLLLGLIYKLGSGVVDVFVGGVLAGDIVADFAIVIVVFFALNLLQHFSSQHLIAQYALAVGVGESEVEKDKFDYDPD